MPTARAYVLAESRMDHLNPDVDLSTVTQADIRKPYNIEFTEMNSTNIPAVLDDFIMRLSPEVLYTMQESDPSTALLQEDILLHLLLQSL